MLDLWNLMEKLGTCESGKCKIPCLCSMCTKGDESLCKTHTSVDEVVSGFYSEYDAFTVRSHDSFDLYMNTNVTDFGLSTIKDRKRELGRNEYCIRPSCRSSGGSILSRCEARDKIIQCKKTKNCSCPSCPFCIAIEVQKFSGIPNDCKDCLNELDDHEAHHLVIHPKCKFCESITRQSNDFKDSDEFEFWHNQSILKEKDDKTCYKCNKILANKKSCRIHVRETHFLDKIECTECEFTTSYERSMKRH